MTPMAMKFSSVEVSSFASLSFDQFIGLIGNDELEVDSEDDVYRAIKEYLKKNTLNDQLQLQLWSHCRYHFSFFILETNKK